MEALPALHSLNACKRHFYTKVLSRLLNFGLSGGGGGGAWGHAPQEKMEVLGPLRF